VQTIQYLTVTIDHVGRRLDNYLFSQLKGLPKSFLYRIIRSGAVRINKKRAKPDYRLRADDVIRVPPLRSTETVVPKSPNKKLTTLFQNAVIFEDKHLLVIDKPAGIAVHGGSGITLGVIEILRALHPYQKHLELVHRLDRDTSGCLLIAKKSSILRELHELLRQGAMQKTYLALVAGHWPKSLTTIDAPLYKNQLRSGERIVQVDACGKACITQFRPIQYFYNTTLVEIIPITGRTHQIRVHALYVKHPIIGDEKYGNTIVNQNMRNLGCKRLFLHASQLAFQLPSTKQSYTLQAKLSADLQRFLDELTRLSRTPPSAQEGAAHLPI